MSKVNTKLVVIVVVALVLGYIVGGVVQTGRCPITGMTICKDRAASCDAAKKACYADKAACSTEGKSVETPAVTEVTN
jgi:hypothetical protein